MTNCHHPVGENGPTAEAMAAADQHLLRRQGNATTLQKHYGSAADAESLAPREASILCDGAFRPEKVGGKASGASIAAAASPLVLHQSQATVSNTTSRSRLRQAANRDGFFITRALVVDPAVHQQVEPRSLPLPPRPLTSHWTQRRTTPKHG